MTTPDRTGCTSAGPSCYPLPAFAQAGAGDLKAQEDRSGMGESLQRGRCGWRLFAGDSALGGKRTLTTGDVVGFGHYAVGQAAG